MNWGDSWSVSSSYWVDQLDSPKELLTSGTWTSSPYESSNDHLGPLLSREGLRRDRPSLLLLPPSGIPLTMVFMTSRTSHLGRSFRRGHSLWGWPYHIGLSLLLCYFVGHWSSSKWRDPSRPRWMFCSFHSLEGYLSLCGDWYKLLSLWTNLHKWLAWIRSSILFFSALQPSVICPKLRWYQLCFDMSAFLELCNFFSVGSRFACKASSMILPITTFNGI